MSGEYPRIVCATDMEAYVEFTQFAFAQFERLGQLFTPARLHDVCRRLLRLSRLMLRARYYRQMARQYIRHARGLALLQNRQRFLMDVD